MIFKKSIKQETRVSVILPNYNYGKYLLKRIKGIENQTYPIHELIILDDMSTDNSQEIINRIKFKYPTKTIFNEKNSGNVFKQWSKGIKNATGDLIWIAEADDMANKRFLENLVPCFKSDDTILAFCDSKQINEHGKTIRNSCATLADDYNSGRYKNDYFNKGTDELKKYLIIKNYIYNASGTLIKKGNYEKILNECTNYKLAGDWHFYIELLKLGNIAYVSKILNSHRIHQNSVTKSTNKQKHYDEIVDIQENLKKCVKIDNETEKQINFQRELLKKVLGL